MECVREVASRLEQKPPDVLILNAGIYQVPRYQCSTGLDNVFQVNFAAPYYLVRTLLPALQSVGGKVVAVGSIAHTNSPTDPGDIDFSQREKSSLVYGNSKRFLMYALYGLFAGKPGLAVTHPGITLTNISAHHPPIIFNLIKGPMKIIFMPPRKAALSILRGVFEDCAKYEWIGPRWFDIWGLPQKRQLSSCPPEEAALILETAERIFSVCITPAE
jgi:NAD(P)-dependent dehydrogenase (short-subunit alcohol dehydrogenase family)